MLKELGRLTEAEECFRRALAYMPRASGVHCNLGSTLYDLGRLEEAEESFEHALALNPDHAEARFALTVLRLRPTFLGGEPTEDPRAAIRKVRGLSEWFDSRQEADDFKAVGGLQPFFLAYDEQDHRDLLSDYGKLCAGVMDRWRAKQRFAPVRHVPGEVIRVGIVSAHVHSHSVWHAIVKGWLRHIDPERVELQVFYTGSLQDDETLFAKSQVSHFEERPRELSDWVKSILDRHLDVLIYPEIGMDPTTLRLASLRLAPIQMVAWGHPMTTGLPTVDYYLSAEDFEPEDAREHYTEELVALPHLGCCFSSPPVSAANLDFAALGIDRESPLLVCPGTPFKYSSRHDWIFPEIARRLSRCQFIFFTLEPHYLAEKLKQRLEGAFAGTGLDLERYVVFVPKQPLSEFHGLMQRADVYLDTLGFSGFNTAMQAVECGLPIVTRKGRFLRGRFGSGILERMRLPELVASSEEDYVALAARLVQDRDYRGQTSERIAASRSALYDDVSPVRALEEFLAKVVRGK
jgi:predicted O-linked N-acetylglucosamine transferase (SPINDLY family)